jgi:molybdopterin converting factor small subunit
LSETLTVSRYSYSIKLIGVLATAAGTRQVSINSETELSLTDVISSLLARVDKRQFKELLIDSATNNPLPNVIMLLDEQDCNLFQGLRTMLDSETVVTIIPVAHGG